MLSEGKLCLEAVVLVLFSGLMLMLHFGKSDQTHPAGKCNMC